MLKIRAGTPRSYNDELPDMTPCPCVELAVRISLEDAERLAAHRRARVAAGADVLAAEAREVANPVLEALVAAGYGE